jgi:hypothetical protein
MVVESDQLGIEVDILITPVSKANANEPMQLAETR